jgi:hypothetical protein
VTLEKWQDIFSDEAQKITTTLNPQNWAEERRTFIIFVNEMDKATEVYAMENGPHGMEKK